MGARKPKFKQYLYESMKKLDTFNFDVLVFQEVNSYWAEEAQAHLNTFASSQGNASSQGPAWHMVHNDKKAILAKESGVLGGFRLGSVGLGLAGLGLAELGGEAGGRVDLVVVHHEPGRALR